jgi:hypothetical protein
MATECRFQLKDRQRHSRLGTFTNCSSSSSQRHTASQHFRCSIVRGRGLLPSWCIWQQNDWIWRQGFLETQWCLADHMPFSRHGNKSSWSGAGISITMSWLWKASASGSTGLSNWSPAADKPCALCLVQLRHCMPYDTAWGNIACLMISSSSSNSRGTTGQPRRLTSWSAYCSCSLTQQHMHGCEQAPAAVLGDAFALQAPVTC